MIDLLAEGKILVSVRSASSVLDGVFASFIAIAALHQLTMESLISPLPSDAAEVAQAARRGAKASTYFRDWLAIDLVQLSATLTPQTFVMALQDARLADRAVGTGNVVLDNGNGLAIILANNQSWCCEGGNWKSKEGRLGELHDV